MHGTDLVDGVDEDDGRSGIDVVESAARHLRDRVHVVWQVLILQTMIRYYGAFAFAKTKCDAAALTSMVARVRYIFEISRTHLPTMSKSLPLTLSVKRAYLVCKIMTV